MKCEESIEESQREKKSADGGDFRIDRSAPMRIWRENFPFRSPPALFFNFLIFNTV